MYRLYLGNLAAEATAETLHGLFQDHGLTPTNILVKRGYAFADCPDQTSFDKAIDTLNGINFMGSIMQVEPSTMSRRRQSNKVQLRNVPTHVSKEDIEHLVATFGSVQRCDLVTNNMENTVIVTYENAEQAQQAVDKLSNYDYAGSVLKVDFAYGRSNGNGNFNRNRPRQAGNNRGTGYPLRILVQSDYVGAIIGRGGQTIRNITQQCKARIDVHRDNQAGLLEKVISIYGQPENCSKACKEIMKVMAQESTATNRGEVSLKTLADDRYCGRIIGKEGKVIKKIREDTDTKVTVSNVQEMPALYPDRVITIKGSPDNMANCEAAISLKLRECYEKEFQNPQQNNMMMGGPIGMQGGGMMPGAGVYGMRPSPYNNMMNQGFYPGNMGGYGGPGGPMGGGGSGGSGGGGGGAPQPQQAPTDACQISVPNSAVGAIIGAGGSNIKQIIRDSNAFVTIEPKKDDDPNPAAERIVTIKGTPEAIWRANYFVFEKLKTEGFAGNDDVRLRTAIRVPRSMVGRVIGKGGKNVRDIQRMTGSMIKLPEDQADQGDDVTVEIFGNFMSTQNAQSRIRALVSQSQLPMPGGPIGGGPGGPPAGPPMRRTPRQQ